MVAVVTFSIGHAQKWITYYGSNKGKHIVLISGDEEYRSEESMPMLAKILKERKFINSVRRKGFYIARTHSIKNM